MKFKLTTPIDKQAVKSYIDSLNSDKNYTVDVTLRKERRTLPSNKLYWLWLACISNETGQDKDDLHDFFKQKFIGFQTKSFYGEKLYSTPSTASLDSKQFSVYLDRICAFAGAELGITLPHPEDLIWDQFYEQYNNYI